MEMIMNNFRIAVAIAFLILTVLTFVHVNAVVGIVMLTSTAIVTWLGHMVDNVKRSTW